MWVRDGKVDKVAKIIGRLGGECMMCDYGIQFLIRLDGKRLLGLPSY